MNLSSEQPNQTSITNMESLPPLTVTFTSYNNHSPSSWILFPIPSLPRSILLCHIFSPTNFPCATCFLLSYIHSHAYILRPISISPQPLCFPPKNLYNGPMSVWVKCGLTFIWQCTRSMPHIICIGLLSLLPLSNIQ